MDTKKILGTTAGVLGIVAVLVFLLVIGPLIMIWGLNLMGYEIDYTFKTLFGAFLVLLAVRVGNFKKSDE